MFTRAMPLATTLLCAGLVAPAALPAQVPAAGSPVRIVEEGRVLGKGTLVRLAGDTVAIQVGSAPPVTIALVGRRQLEVPTGRLKHHTMRGLGIGGGAGLLLGAVIGAATYKPVPCHDWFCLDLGPGVAAAGGATVGMLGGMLLGAMVGSASTSPEWRRVAAPAARHLVVAPRNGGVELGVSVSF